LVLLLLLFFLLRYNERPVRGQRYFLAAAALTSHH
jgi:hypothetical protein